MSAWHVFALQQQVPVSDTFCWHSQHCSPGVTLFTYTHQAVWDGKIWKYNCLVQCLKQGCFRYGSHTG